jgi:ribosomal protein S18 acetylase RimI-like enzyme
MNIRQLTRDDAPAWRKLRIRMLRDHPEAFGEHIDDFLKRPQAEIEARVIEGNVFGAFAGEALVGAGGWRRESGLKRAHIGYIWGMYVAPQTRSQGVGRMLVARLLEEVRKAGCVLAELSVAELNTVAYRLYVAAGFKEWGREPDALRAGDVRVTEIHMSRPV